MYISVSKKKKKKKNQQERTLKEGARFKQI